MTTMEYRSRRSTLHLFIAFSLIWLLNAPADAALTSVSRTASTTEGTTTTTSLDQSHHEGQEKKVQLSVEGLEGLHLAECPMKQIEDLEIEIIGDNESNDTRVVMPQLECVECGRSCGRDGKGKCVQLVQRVKEQLWKRGCACQEPKNE